MAAKTQRAPFLPNLQRGQGSPASHTPEKTIPAYQLPYPISPKYVVPPLKKLELGEKDAYLIERNTGKPYPILLNDRNMLELYNIEPKYITVSDHIFGTATSHLMKTSASSKATDQWKGICRYILDGLGLCFDSEGSVEDKSKVPEFASCIKFGARKLPVRLIKEHLKNWKTKITDLVKLKVSFQDKLDDKEKMAEELLSGLTFEKIWCPSMHEESLFCDGFLGDYQKKLQKDYSLSLKDDPVLLYAAVSSNRDKMAVLAIADHAVQLTFCGAEDLTAHLELQDVFLEVTDTDDRGCVSELELDSLLERLRK